MGCYLLQNFSDVISEAIECRLTYDELKIRLCNSKTTLHT